MCQPAPPVAADPAQPRPPPDPVPPSSGRVRVRINGQTQVRRVRGPRRGRFFVLVRVPRRCGVYPITVSARGRLPAKRIWVVRGGLRIEKFTVGNKGTGPTPQMT